jgi:hypothetical protein
VEHEIFLIPVIIGATGTVSKGFKNIPQNNTSTTFNILSTKNIISKVLQSEWWASPVA